MDALCKWLSDNPIQEESDIDFITRAAEHHCHVCIAAQSSNVTEQDGLASNWTGNVPFLRLIHCVVDDSVSKRSLKLGHVSTSTRPSATALPGS
jgi:hypothetical protein